MFAYAMRHKQNYNIIKEEFRLTPSGQAKFKYILNLIRLISIIRDKSITTAFLGISYMQSCFIIKFCIALHCIALHCIALQNLQIIL